MYMFVGCVVLVINKSTTNENNIIYYIYNYILYIYIFKSLDVVQSLYFGSKLPSSGTYK